MDCGEEVCGNAVVSGGDATEILEAAKHALDGITAAIEDRRETRLPAPVDLGRDVRRRATCLDLSPDCIGIVVLREKVDFGDLIVGF
jgi:acyl dehydratase